MASFLSHPSLEFITLSLSIPPLYPHHHYHFPFHCPYTMNFLTRHVLSADQPQKKSLIERVAAPVRASKGWQAVKRIVAKVIVAQDDLTKAGPLPESVDLVLASAVSINSAVGGDFVCQQACKSHIFLVASTTPFTL
jgi:hypothetical protein